MNITSRPAAGLEFIARLLALLLIDKKLGFILQAPNFRTTEIAPMIAQAIKPHYSLLATLIL